MCGRAVLKAPFAVVGAILIVYGLLLAYFQGFPDARVAELLQKLAAPLHARHPTDNTAKLSASHGRRTPLPTITVTCDDFGLTEGKVLQERQLYHKLVQPNSNATGTSCQSKYQHQCFRKNSPSIPPLFLSALREYEQYHEGCTRNLNITALGIAGDAPHGCKYLVWRPMEGMGNQLLSIVCAFVYSLLTHRTMLIGTDTHIHSYLCNPFPLSSWLLSDDFPDERLRYGAMRVAEYLHETLHGPRHNNISMPLKNHLQVFIICCDQDHDREFFCPASQKLFQGINWIFYMGHEYTLPAFYFIPDFRRKLNLWFPDHDAFMHASRYLLHPRDAIWQRISQFYKTHIDGAENQVGIQVRVWGKESEPPMLNAQISRCVAEQMLIPEPQQQAGRNSSNNQSREASVITKEILDVTGQRARPDIVVLVASLRAEYREHLAQQYSYLDGSNGSTYVRVLTASMQLSQRTGNVAHDEAAIIDIWLLSFMQEMVLTPFSTFGSVASGMAGIVPILFINYGQEKTWEAACLRSNVAGPCYMFYPKNLTCELDQPRFGLIGPVVSTVPEVKTCKLYSGLGVESRFYIP